MPHPRVCLLHLLFAAAPAGAQVAGYSFTQGAGAFSLLTRGVVLSSSTTVDDVSFLATLPFAFQYGVSTYSAGSAVTVNTNGWIALGTSPGNLAYAAVAGGAGSDIVAAFNRDLRAQAGSSLRTDLSGVPPYQTFTVQWDQYRRFGTPGVGDSWTFQIRLFETTNAVEVVFGPMVAGPAPRSNTVQTGLRGATNADFHVREVVLGAHTWAASAGGANNAATCAFSTTELPYSGLTFQWGYVAPAPPSNDDCVDAISAAAGVTGGTTAAATPSAAPDGGCGTFGPGVPDVWFRFEPEFDCVLHAAISGSGAAAIGVYIACDAPTAVACASSAMSFAAFGGTQYMVRIAASSTPSAFSLAITCSPSVTNDECASAIALFDGVNPAPPSGSSTLTFTNAGASDSAGFASCVSGHPGAGDVFFAYTASASGLATFDTCTPPGFGTGTLTDTILEVYASCSPGVSLACDDDGCANPGFASLAVAPVTAGVAYLIRVSSWSAGQSGTFRLTITPPVAAPPPPPPNDDCFGGVAVFDGTNGPFPTDGATADAVVSSCGDGVADVWFQWTAADTGTAFVDTHGSTMNTALAVYDACGATVALACNDDAPATVSAPAGETSFVAFPTTAGTTYHFEIECGGRRFGGGGGAPPAPAVKVNIAPVKNRPMVGTRGEIKFVNPWFGSNYAEWKTKLPTVPLPPFGAGGAAWPASLVIYVHGFDNTAADAQTSTNQIAKELAAAGYAREVIGFTWDSNPGVTEFNAAKSAADLNAKALAQLLKDLQTACPGIKINLVSHSLGARVIFGAFINGGTATTANTMAAAVDNEVLEKGEEFAKAPAGATLIKNWFNDEDDVLGGAYNASEWNVALGSTGSETLDERPAGVEDCDAEPKLKKSALPGGKTPNPTPSQGASDVEDDHSAYIWCPEFIKCLVKKLE